MALFDTTWYVNDGDNSTTGWWAVGAWNNNGGAGRAWTAGQIVRQSGTPTVGNERCYICIVAGTGGTGADPLTTFTRGVKITDAGATWQECTGASAVNGDVTNTPVWTAATAYTLGQIIKRVNAASYWICSTAGTSGASEPAWANNTAGTTRTDGAGALVWTCLGVVGNFTGWQAPHARLASAFASTWGAAGNKFFVADNHAETQTTSITLLNLGTAASPISVYSVDHTAAVPPTTVLAGASISTTGNTAINIGTANGCSQYYYGITFNNGSGSNSQNLSIGGSNVGPYFFSFDTCALNLVLTGASARILLGGDGIYSSKFRLKNTTMSFGAATDGINVSANDVIWENTASAIAGTTPTTLFAAGINVRGGLLVCRGVDFSALGSGKTIVGSSGNYRGRNIFVDCKFGASVTVAATPTDHGLTTDIVHSDSGATNYFASRYIYEGTLTPETTIVRTGGATDGTTSVAWKIVTTANSKWIMPFESLPITVWNDITTAITVTIYGNFTSVPNDDDIWMEIEYLGSSLTPMGSFATTTKANGLAASAATNNTSDGSTWGAGGTTAFKITSPSFTPGMKGPINITIKAAKATSTFYIDPKPAITGVSIAKSEILAPGVYANERANPAMLVNHGALVG